MVSIRLHVGTPTGGWQGLNHTAEGRIINLEHNGSRAVVQFEGGSKIWKGRKSDLERVRPITVGDLVKVGLYFFLLFLVNVLVCVDCDILRSIIGQRIFIICCIQSL